MESAENQAQPQPGKEFEVENNPPRSKTETIALLNESIDRLEETIAKIGKDSATMPSSSSIDTLLATAQELEAAVTSTEKDTETKIPTLEPLTEPAVPQTVPQPLDTQAKPPKAASPTPKPNPRKRNTGLIAVGVAAIAISIVTVFWLGKPQQFANLLPAAKTTPEPIEIVVAPEAELETQPSEVPITEGETSTADNIGIVRDISAMDFPPEIEPVAAPIEDVVETVIPEELSAPSRPKNLKMVAIKPKLNFTPEQNLVATLETRVSELIETYPQELIQSVSVDLPASNLLVKVADDWYELGESAQNDLGNEILERARTFSFQNLELRDDIGTLVARNPIVGKNIIILQNSRQ